jgi:hypothetical protein
MSKTWKWIIGIAIALVVLAGIGITLHLVALNAVGEGGWVHPMTGYRYDALQEGTRYNPHMLPFKRGGFTPLFGGFMLLGGIFRLIVPLAVLGGVVWFAYQQGKKAVIKEASAASVTPTFDAAPDEEETPPNA